MIGTDQDREKAFKYSTAMIDGDQPYYFFTCTLEDLRMTLEFLLGIDQAESKKVVWRNLYKGAFVHEEADRYGNHFYIVSLDMAKEYEKDLGQPVLYNLG